MKTISDRQTIIDAITELHLSEDFDTQNMQIVMRSYAKGEQIVSPLTPLNYFILIISGKVRIYQLDEDSTLHAIVIAKKREILGAHEFVFDDDDLTLYAEAITPVKCLIIPFHQDNINLKTDYRFLTFLLRYSLLTNIQTAAISHIHSELRDKIIFYIKNICPNQMITSINDTVDALHCSRRQLQRTLKQMCDEGILVHEKKGCYRLQ